MPLDLYEHYIECMNQADMNSEGEFVFFCNQGMKFYYHIMRAASCIEEILSGEQMITYSDFTKLQLLTRIFTQAQQLCETMEGESDLPYASAKEYVNCMLEECSILKRIHLSKPIPVQDLCNHVDMMSVADPEDFNRLFFPEYSEDIKEGLMSFEGKSEDRLDLLYAHVFVAAKMGL